MLKAFRTWFLAARPWSYSVSITPVALGTALAWTGGHPVNWWLFVLTAAAGVSLHTGVNYLNTYGDFVTGVDTIESAPSCPHLVTGQLRPQAVWRAGVIFLGLATLMGLVLVFFRGWPVFVFGALGLVGGYCYTTSPFPYKYIGLGPVMVFFLMGPLMVCPAYFIQSRELTWGATWVSLIIGCLVTGVIQANDIQDIEHDRDSGIKTMAMALGRERAACVFSAFYIAAYVILVSSVALRVLLPGALLPLALLPDVWRTLRTLRSMVAKGEEITELLFWAAQFHTKFGVLLIAGIVANGWLAAWGLI